MPQETLITKRNLWFQRVQTIKTNRKKRWRNQLFTVEGVRSINQLRANPSWEVEALLYAHGARLSDWARDTLKHLPAANHLAFDPALLAELSDKESTSEIMAVVRMPVIEDQPLAPDLSDLAIVLDRPGNPGNLGTIIRSGDALGSRAVVITGHAADPFDPLTVRAAAGSFFNMAVRRMTSRARLTEWISATRGQHPNLQVVGTSAHGSVAPRDCDFTRPTLLMLGSETHGLSDWLREQCDVMVGIRMAGSASSLNLACATTVFLYEAHAQRERAHQLK